MARKGFSIEVAADTRDAQRGIKSGVLDPLEDVEAALEDVSDGSRDAGRSLEDSMEDSATATKKLAAEGKDTGDALEKAMEGAQKASADFEGDIKDLRNTVRDQARKAGRDLDSGIGDGMDSASETVGEFKDEARSNFSEIASSFSGDMDSAADLVQGTLGGLAGSLSGPIAIGLGALGAAAGLFYTQWRENAEKTEQRISDMYDDMKESGDRFLSDEYIRQAISDIISGSEDATISLGKVRDIASATGLPEGTVLAAAAGDAEALNIVLPLVQDGVKATTEELNAAKWAQDGYGDVTPLEEARGKWLVMRDALLGVVESTEAATDRVDLYQDAVKAMEGRGGSGVILTEERDRYFAMQKAAEDARASVENIPGTVTVKVKADTSSADQTFRNFFTKNRPAVSVPVSFVTRDGKRVN